MCICDVIYRAQSPASRKKLIHTTGESWSQEHYDTIILKEVVPRWNQEWMETHKSYKKYQHLTLDGMLSCVDHILYAMSSTEWSGQRVLEFSPLLWGPNLE